MLHKSNLWSEYLSGHIPLASSESRCDVSMLPAYASESGSGYGESHKYAQRTLRIYPRRNSTENIFSGCGFEDTESAILCGVLSRRVLKPKNVIGNIVISVTPAHTTFHVRSSVPL